ncbi:MAG: efflux RND transporter periplasmic adaptor subunit [Alphaproteobacteria bacterium]|nr:efflux RND transporter periplasmic adaptor subunit [Alphaproteobacteria bacterium]
MQAGTKAVVGVLVIGALAFAQWKYGVGQWALNAVHPQQQAASGAAPAGGAKRAAAPVAVKLATAKKTDFPLIERSYGTMASPQAVNINARIASQVTRVNVQDGQMVKTGDVLLELDDRALQATLAKDEATLAKDQAVLANNEIQLQRAQTLAARNAGNLADVDNAVAAQKSTQQIIDADKAVIDADKLQLDFAKIKAPFDGKLGAIAAVTGALTSTTGTQTALMTITQMQPLKVNFRLAEQVLPAIRQVMDAGGTVTVRVYASGAGQLLDTGKLTFIDSSVDVSSGTIGMAAEVGNAKLTLWPGQRVNVEVEYGKSGGALTVPAVAVQQGQIGSFVWLVDDQNKVTATPVKVARYEADQAAIAEGLKDGAQVVVEGQAKLANGTEIRTGKPADDTQGSAGAKPADAKTTETQPTDGSGAQAATLPADATAAADKKKKKDQSSGDTQQ